MIVEDTIQTQTTGRIDMPEGYASGEVVFANRSESEVVIPKGTYVRTGSGETARFSTVTEEVLPPQYNATVRVPIMAVEPGPAGNVRALTINVIEGRLASVVEVINDSPTGGGTTKQVPMVTIEDQNAVYDLALGQLKERAYAELVAELEEGEFIPPESLETQIMSYTYGQALAERSEVTSITMKVVTRGTAIRNQDIDALATRFLESAAGGELSLVPGTLQVTRSNQVTIHGTEVTFDVSATGDVASTIDSEGIAQALRGKTIQEAVDWLNETYALAAEPEIALVPPQWQRLPVLPARTRIHIEVTTQ
ncbi:MAG: baseplate J/gp47 family protein [Anaerolineales bacterium]